MRKPFSNRISRADPVFVPRKVRRIGVAASGLHGQAAFFQDPQPHGFGRCSRHLGIAKLPKGF